MVLHWASGEKQHQAVVKYIPLTPSLCPNSSWLPLERKPCWLLDAASASHGRLSPSREVLELSGARKHSTGCWGFILIFIFFSRSQLHTLGWRLGCSQRCRHGGKKKSHWVAHVFQLLLKKNPPKNGEERGRQVVSSWQELLLLKRSLFRLRTPRCRRGLGKPSWERTQNTKGQDFVPSFLNR